MGDVMVTGQIPDLFEAVQVLREAVPGERPELKLEGLRCTACGEVFVGEGSVAHACHGLRVVEAPPRPLSFDESARREHQKQLARPLARRGLHGR